MTELLTGLLLGLSITAPIGPTNIEVIRRGLKEGWLSAILFCAGVVIALMIYLVVASTGLSYLTENQLFNNSLLAFGVLVLFYLSYMSFQDYRSKKEIEVKGSSENAHNFVPGIILTLSNPAVLLLWTGILGADLTQHSSLSDTINLVTGILVGVIVFFIALVFLIHNGRKFINHQNFKYVSLGASVILLYFAVRFGYTFLHQVNFL